MSEHDEQKALFEWAERMIVQGRIPELVNMFAIPNGAWFKNKAIAVKMKQEGLKKGVPDIFLAVPSGDYQGLFIEMKLGENGQTKEQKEWSSRLREMGYKVDVYKSWVGAIAGILAYLDKPRDSFSEFFE